MAPSFHAQAAASTIWPSTAVPTHPSDSDTAAVELGVKFRANSAGSVAGVRFYKGTGNTGTHTGSLWNMAGSRLATATFSGETATGWQQVTFTTPVSISANTTYVASYYAPKGHYAGDSNYFASASVTNGPLTALQDGTDGGNGVYKYAAGGGFPNSTHQSSNYWVDVVFQATTDTTPPTVTTVTPANAAANVNVGSAINATFNEALTASTVNTNTFELRTTAGVAVAATVSYTAGTQTAALTPNSPLAASTSYTATLRGGATDPRVKDAAGNALAGNYAWSFTTAAATVTPSMPILVVTSNAQPFTKYYTEILHAEGLNSYTAADLTSVTATMLNNYDVVILGDQPVTAAQVTMLTTWVNAGGNLIALHPDKKLASLLGLTDQSSTLADGYMLINTAGAPGNGITGQTMQYHGSADKYAANGGTTTVATLYSNESTATTNPAVTVRSVGSNGGQAAAFTYDLARSVVYTHQGNPAWAGQNRDGDSLIRPDDLFFGAKAGDVQPDYVNLNKVAIPQADEQQRLLSNVIEYVNQDRKPLPKLWYLPNGKKAAIVMAGDDHATANGTQSTFDYLLANSPAGCVVANWECLRATSWMYSDTPVSNAQAASYVAQGFNLGAHVSSGCNNWTPDSLEDNFTNDLAIFQAKYTSLPAQQANRIHCVAWSDWATAPKVGLDHGIRMDLSYYYWPGAWVQNRPGFFTGSGTPMRFADTDGTMIDVYQQPSHLVNESGMTFPAAINTQLDRALGSEGYYGAFGTHYDYTDTFDRQLVQAAQAHNVPVVTVQQLLDWTDGRNNSSFSQMNWSGNNLAFTASIDSKAGTMMRGMLPVVSAKGILQGLTKNGSTVSYTLENIKGITYAMFPAGTGNYVAAYAPDTTAPTVTITTPTNGATNVATDISPTATFNEAMNPGTITNSTVTMANGGPVPASVSYNSTSRQVTLTPSSPLSTNTTYTITIGTGAKDLAGNALASSYAWSFTTTATATNYTIWPSSTVPAVPSVNDPAAVELGVKFRSDINGYIKGVRFYKGGTNTGTHTGSLWSSSGTLLATGTFASETATGWQELLFTTPVAVTANTTYVASYHTVTGNYAATNFMFTSPVNNAPLHALQDGADGGNGLYLYGAGGFPTNTHQSSNYWVDVVFSPSL
ncbi:MAG TPA: DUF4082 domain-containing protein [Nevskiaceae bacterium]|nr:DUF4082 domain-containing protein [Nevskiaceae bacterium]